MKAGRRLLGGGALLVAVLASVVGGSGPAAAAAAQPTPGRPRVLVATVDDAITPVIADHLIDGVDRARDEGFAAFVVRLDTPGGLDVSMRDIIKRFLASEVPVVVYVSPHGGRAASAGALIAFSAHVAAMAPGTAIGAATPVGLEGGDLSRKVVNDAAAFAESVARVRGRNVEFAVQTVREGRSVSAAEAVELGAVDLLAGSLDELLEAIDGRIVAVEPGGREVALGVAGAEAVDYDLGLIRRIRQTLADPNLAFLFISLGTLAVLYEVASPGLGAGGVLGAILLLLGLFSMAVLPVNAVGLMLLAVAAVLFAAEVLAPGIGVAAAGGSVALVFSGLFLFDEAPGLEVSAAVVIPVALVVGVGVILAGRLVVTSRRGASLLTGTGLLVDRVVVVQDATGVVGRAHLEGAWWRLRSGGPPLVDGAAVRVVAVEGLDLVVEPEGDGAPNGPAPNPQQTGAP